MLDPHLFNGSLESEGPAGAQYSLWAVEGNVPEHWNIKEVFDSIDGHQGSKDGACWQFCFPADANFCSCQLHLLQPIHVHVHIQATLRLKSLVPPLSMPQVVTRGKIPLAAPCMSSNSVLLKEDRNHESY